VSAGWRPAPLALAVDLEHGGRWTSLRSAGREWLWTNPDPEVVARRGAVRPGDAFVDAGGVEECFPGVRGRPDHGDVWSRPWSGSADDAAVDLPGSTRLRRTIATDATGVHVDHEITGTPGTRFVHAVHALLDLSPAARLVAPTASAMIMVGDEAETLAKHPWPSGLDVLGAADGTATCVILPACAKATVVDGDHALTFAWTFPDRPDLCSLMLWRNLGGWPAERPYRSIGIEPMIGRTAEPAAGDGSAACSLDASGRARWSLHLTASAR
jgi:hypothetical protein